jgi:signal transduction histidine kinase
VANVVQDRLAGSSSEAVAAPLGALVKSIHLALDVDNAGGAARAARNAEALLASSGLLTTAQESIRARNLCGWAYMASGYFPGAAAALTKGLQEADLAGDVAMRTRASVNLGVLAGLCGQFEAAREACAAGRAAFASLRLPEAAVARFNTAWLWIMEADAAAIRREDVASAAALLKANGTAEQFLAEAASYLAQGTRIAPAACEADLMASLWLRMGRVDQARKQFERALRDEAPGARARPTLCVVEAELALGEQRPDAAVSLLQTPQPPTLAWRAVPMRLQLRRLEALAQAHTALEQHEKAVLCTREHLRLVLQCQQQQLLALPMLGLGASRAHGVREENLTYMIHDVRAPLGCIIATLRDNDNPNRAEVAAAVADRTLARIDGLLQHLRLDTLLGMGREVFDLGSVADDACEELSLRASNAGSQLEREIDFNGGLLVRGYRDALLRAVVNLLDNALNASPVFGRVVLRCRREGDAVVVTVRDQGKGMPATARATLSGLSSPAGVHANPLLSSGFGLRYVARVARMHDARLDVQVGDEGSTVALLVPSASPLTPAVGLNHAKLGGTATQSG